MKRYRFSIGKHVSESLAVWFNAADITETGDGRIRFTVEVPDDAAFYGVVNKIKEFGIPILEITLLD